MEFKLRKKFIELNIKDEQDKKIGKIRYNPSDTASYKKLMEIAETINEYQIEAKKMGNIPNLSSEELETIEDLEKENQNIQKLKKFMGTANDTVKKVKLTIDDILGSGVSEMVCEGTDDLEEIARLIETILPTFEKARDGKVNKYLKDDSDVMD